MAVNTESTATFASLGTIFNLVATSILVFDNFPNQILPSIWFGLNSVSFGLCAYIFQAQKIRAEIMTYQDEAGWMAATLGLPCLASHFLFKNGDSKFFALFHILQGIGFVGLFVKDKYLGRVKITDDSKLHLNFEKIALLVGGFSTLTIVATCYKTSDLNGLFACFSLIMAHIGLATDMSLRMIKPFDCFLLGLTLSNYLFFKAV